MVAIASGGCNVLSYLTADPASILAVDLNRAHVALTKLKLAAVRQLPSYNSFFRFFGEADSRANISAYRRFIRFAIDPETRRYWEGRELLGRRRVTLFKRDIYRHGLLGGFIGAAHLVARLHGANPRKMMRGKTLAEQQRFFDTVLAPLFDKPLVRWLTSKKTSLYGLGIPPAQYEALALARAATWRRFCAGGSSGSPAASRSSENYFAWQAFGRGYPRDAAGPLPPYLRRENYEDIRGRAGRVRGRPQLGHRGARTRSPASLDAYVLLDAQDWMTDVQLERALACDHPYREAGRPRRLPHRRRADAPPRPDRRAAFSNRWNYEAEDSRALGAEDRSSIYGGFHLYVFSG